MSSYREQGLLHKKIQIGIVDARPVTAKAKKARPVKLELFEIHPWGRAAPGWQKHGSYIKAEQAHMAAKKKLRDQNWLYDKTKYRIDGVEYAAEI